MAWTQSDLDAIDAALLSGKRKVTFADGRSVEYHSLDEMQRLRRTMKSEIAESSSTVPARRVTVARMRR